MGCSWAGHREVGGRGGKRYLVPVSSADYALFEKVKGGGLQRVEVVVCEGGEGGGGWRGGEA